MKLSSPNPKTLKAVCTLKRRYWLFRLDVLPWIFLYIALVISLLLQLASVLYVSIASAFVVGVHILFILFEQWSTRFRTLVGFRQSTPDIASHIAVICQPYCGQSAIVPLLHTPSLKFVFQCSTYTFDYDKKQFIPLSYPDDLSSTELHSTQGLTTEQADDLVLQYGENQYVIPLPSFFSLFKQHAVAPFFVFQVFCVLLWCLDDYFFYSLFTLIMLVFFEAQMVAGRLKSMKELSNLIEDPRPVYVYRNKKWLQMLSSKILPHDVISLSPSVSHRRIPCDCVILSGNCIVDESFLTGESTPQQKESITSDLATVNVIHSGSNLIAVGNQSSDNVHKPPDGGIVCFVLKTGFGTNHGKLLQTMLFQTEKISVNNKESGLFLVILLFFATLAAGIVFSSGFKQIQEISDEDLKNSKIFKLIVNCLLILTAVVPPELPMELSLAVTSSLNILKKIGIFCTEPFRIPLAGKVDTCLFDKTGTITEDCHFVRGICMAESRDFLLNSVDNSSLFSKITIAGANGLGYSNGKLIGDSLEIAGLKSTGFSLTQNDVIVAPGKLSNLLELKILKKFHFRSNLQRMSTICRYFDPTSGQKSASLLYLVKGSPEKLRDMFASVPEAYDENLKYFQTNGDRVLALGYKQTDLKISELNSVRRQDTETNLIFAGFLIFNCPVRQGSDAVIAQLINSKNRCVILTGDAVLTAVHVAQSIKMIGHRPSTRNLFTKGRNQMKLKCTCGRKFEKSFPLVLVQNDDVMNDFYWTRVNQSYGARVFDLFEPCVGCFELCLDGNGLSHLHSTNLNFLKSIINYVAVFGRVDPNQKAQITSMLIDQGNFVSMIGDGSNDVGALRKSHVGVALVEGKEKIKKLQNSFSSGRTVVSEGKAVVSDNSIQSKSKKVKKSQKNSKYSYSLKQFQQDLAEDQLELVKPGDASLASPFSSCLRGISGLPHVLTMGRASVVSILQVYKILAINCLLTGYSLSVLYLKGVEFSDNQMLISGILTAFVSSQSPKVNQNQEET
ncbi:hypothetical protein GEMRC1_002706 [Eukaryota sp. GEM-RC1]